MLDLYGERPLLSYKSKPETSNASPQATSSMGG